MSAGEAVFLADLHLAGQRPATIARFVEFTGRLGPECEAVWFLGDFFDAWLGPRHLRLPAIAPVLDALARLVARGVEVVVLRGNRDFLLDEAFERRTGARLAGDACVARLGERRALLLHGDALCTDDRAYLRLRRCLRSPAFGALARAMPTPVVRTVAFGLRRLSRASVSRKSPRTMAVVPQSASRAALEAGCDLILCGHVHRAEVSEIEGATLVVLPAWEEEGRHLRRRGDRLVFCDAPGRPLPSMTEVSLGREPVAARP